MKKLISSFKRRKELAFIVASLSILLLLSISPAAASVGYWDYSPQKLVSGDALNIKGNASPGEKIDLFVNFEKTVPVSEGKFEYFLEDVKIPKGLNNRFTVEAVGAENLNVRVKMLIWITKSSEASGNSAIVTQSSVPQGTYKIKIEGDAGEGVSEVKLKITAFQGIEADSKGDFSYCYSTKSTPPGNFEVNAGGITKEITILPEEYSDSTNFMSINFTDKVVYFLNHTSDLSEGNWIEMGSLYEGRNIQLPQPITITYSGQKFENYGGVSWNQSSGDNVNYTLNYSSFSPRTTFPVYLPDENVNMSFFGNSSLKGKADIYVLNVTSKSLYGILEAFNTENMSNLADIFNKTTEDGYKDFSAVFGENGDLLDYDLGAFGPGQYCVVMVQKNEDRSLTVLSETAFVVSEYGMNVLAPSSLEEGKNLDIFMELEGTPENDNYTYGAFLINEQAYRANIEIVSNGAKNSTSIMINGVNVIDEFGINASNYNSKLTKYELQKEIQTLIGEGNGSIAIGENGQNNLSLTASDLPEGHYYLFAGAYGPNKKIAGLTQFRVEITPIPTSESPVANFTSSVTAGYTPLAVQFTDLSENEAGRIWDFGDGTNSTEQNPEHTYSAAGNYTVNLTSTNENGISSKLSTITVLEQEQSAVLIPLANFSSSVTAGYSPLTVRFTDLSENATGWDWNFGDGTNSTEQNPEHTYSAAGNYTVTLMASNTNGTASTLAAINVLNVTGPYAYAYITNYHNSTVSIIDTSTNTVIKTVDVGRNPFGVAVSSDGTMVYVTNWGSNTVSVIDAFTNTVTATLKVGKRPYGVAVSPDGSKVYVTNELSNTVSVIDAITNTVTATVPAGSYPSGVVFSPDGAKVYVANEGGTVSVIDTVTNTMTANIAVGSTPIAIAVSPDGAKVYVTNYESNTVSVIDTSTNTVTATVAVGSCSGGIAVSPDGSKVYVTNELSNTVSVIDTSTNTVTATVDVGSSLWGVAVSPDGSKVYVANENSNTVSVIDAATNTVTTTVKVGSGPIAFGKFIGPIPAPTSSCNSSTIYGYGFNDFNMNKKKNGKEAGISNMTISLNGYDTCKGKLVSKTMKTDFAGYYEFNGVNPGVYVVSESFAIGWLPTTNVAYTLNVPSNSTSIKKDFGNTKFLK
ncbi:TIGR04279 domain-containing protein [Methanosarcina sp.]|uniref:TIGR04279 domain-containing protein n=1 Tax=Methanosarcina sp. TaxID=2213 RepID=UPI003BB7E926